MSDTVNINVSTTLEKVNITVAEECEEITLNVVEDSETINLVISEVAAIDPSINVRITALENRTNISSYEQITINEAQADYINA